MAWLGATKSLAVASAIAFALSAPAQTSASHGDKPETKACPQGVARGSRCLTGRDSAGAYYWLAVPPEWNGVLVVHAHGGPELGEPRAERAAASTTP